MKIYLAARYSRRLELAGYAEELRAEGHTITARWLHGEHQMTDEGLSAEASADDGATFAVEDFRDVCRAELLIAFSETPRVLNGSRGGRHVELGIALGRGLSVLVVGPRENVFHCLPNIHVFETWRECLHLLSLARLESEIEMILADSRT